MIQCLWHPNPITNRGFPSSHRRKEHIMAITADFHLHSSFSGDSTEPMEHMIAGAHKKGLTHICFTEHMDINYPVSETTPAGTFLVNTDSYLYDLARFQDACKDSLRILFGIELGLQPHLSKALAAYTHAYEFDFIIGSTHVADGKDPYYPAFYENRSEEEAYREYFESVIENIKKCSHFDVFGHLDYVVRYGPEKDKHYSYAKYQDLFDTMLTLLLEKEKGIELNTGSLRSGTKDVSPCREVLKRYRELGGEIITIGSDAHCAKDIAADFHLASEILSDCGFHYYCIFEKRLPEYRKL